MGDDPPTANESTQAMLEALTLYGPDAIRSINKLAPETAQATFEANRVLAPQQAGLERDIYAQYGPEMNRIGAEINRANQLAASQTELDITRGPGGEVVSEADRLQRRLDPEFYANREKIGQAISKFLEYDPNRLSAGEREEIARGIGATGGNVSDSAMNTIQNAQTFGSALQGRRNTFGDAISRTSAALPGLKSGMSGFEIATRRPLTSNTGENRLPSAPTTTGDQAQGLNFGFSNNLVNEIGANQRTEAARRKSMLDNMEQVSRIGSNVTSSISSFV